MVKGLRCEKSSATLELGALAAVERILFTKIGYIEEGISYNRGWW